MRCIQKSVVALERGLLEKGFVGFTRDCVREQHGGKPQTVFATSLELNFAMFLVGALYSKERGCVRKGLVRDGLCWVHTRLRKRATRRDAPHGIRHVERVELCDVLRRRAATEKMRRPWSQQARQLTPRRGTVAHLGNLGCCVHIHTWNLSPAGHYREHGCVRDESVCARHVCV